VELRHRKRQKLSSGSANFALWNRDLINCGSHCWHNWCFQRLGGMVSATEHSQRI